MQELMCFSAFYVNTWNLLCSLKLQEGGYTPLAF